MENYFASSTFQAGNVIYTAVGMLGNLIYTTVGEKCKMSSIRLSGNVMEILPYTTSQNVKEMLRFMITGNLQKCEISVTFSNA